MVELEFTSIEYRGTDSRFLFRTLCMAHGTLDDGRYVFARICDENKIPPGQFPPDFEDEAREAFRKRRHLIGPGK